jgi:MYXO-CTERM domain-containing protein
MTPASASSPAAGLGDPCTRTRCRKRSRSPRGARHATLSTGGSAFPIRHSAFWIGLSCLAGFLVVLPAVVYGQLANINFELGDALPVNAGPDAGVQAFVLRDLTKDNRADLVVVDPDASQVDVRIANADGGFNDPSVYSVGNTPVAVEVADVDSDGNPDIIAANEFDENVSVIFGDGDGNFGSRITIDLDGNTPLSLALGDFDRDGKQDLAVLDDFDELCLFRNTGNRTFAPFNEQDGSIVCEVVDGSGSIVVRAGDFDGKNGADLVVLNQDSANLTLFTNDGTANFTSRSISSVGVTPVDMRVGLINGDVRDDLALVDHDIFDPENTYILLGQSSGLGTLNQASVELGPTALALCDLNDDALTDIVSSNDQSNVGISYTLGFGNGSFESSASAPLGATRIGMSIGIDCADIDDDGLNDFVALNEDGSELRVAFNRSNNEPTPTWTTKGTQVTQTPTSGTPQPTSTPTPTVPTVTPTPTVTSSPVPTVPLGRCDIAVDGEPVSVATGDFNRDGNPDVVYADQGQNRVSVLFLKPELFPTSFECAPQPAGRQFALSAKPAAVAVGDLNRDGRLDIAVATSAGVATLLANPATEGDFFNPVNHTVGSNPRAVAIADLNRDGRPDIVAADRGDNSVSILYGHGDGTFDAVVSLAAGRPLTAVVVTDVNRDGNPDLITASEDTREIVVFLQDATAEKGFRQLTAVSMTAAPTALVAADFSRDGVPDLAVTLRATNGDGSFQVLTTVVASVGGGVSFQNSALFPTGQRPSAIGAGDFAVDGPADGILDVVIANSTEDTLTFYLGGASGQFSVPRTPLAVGAGPASLALADFDRDGKLDVVTADTFGHTLTLLRSGRPPATPTATNTSTPTLTPTITLSPTSTRTPTISPTGTATPTPTPTATRTTTRTRVPTATTVPTDTPPRPFALSGSSCAIGAGEDKPGAAWLVLIAVGAAAFLRRQVRREEKR